MTGPTTPVVVSGGASGIGASCAGALAGEGRAIAIWDRNEAQAERVASDLATAHGVDVVAIGIDVTDADAVDAAARRSHDALGPIGGFVHAAGVIGVSALGTLNHDAWDAVLDVNLRAAAIITQALCDDLASQPGSAVVGISSIEGHVGNAGIPAYCASKSGLLGLVRSMAVQLAPRGVRVNAVCPGYIDTPMTAPHLAEASRREGVVARTPLGRIGQPEDVCGAVCFLLSDAASFITGQHLTVDGGMLASG